MYYTVKGDYMKAFSTYDGFGVQMLQNNDIIVAILTSENTDIVKARAKKLNIKVSSYKIFFYLYFLMHDGYKLIKKKRLKKPL